MTTFNILVQDGDFGWSNNFTDADEALRYVAASLYHDEHPSVIRCDDGDVKVMSPSELPAGISLEEALVELDAYYRELSYTDEAEINGWDRDSEPQWVKAVLHDNSELRRLAREYTLAEQAKRNRALQPKGGVRWIEATLVPIEYAVSRKFERECDEFSHAAEAYEQAQFEEPYDKPLLASF